MMNANDSSCISSARENVTDNIKISVKDSLGQHKQKHHITVLLLFTTFECKTKEVPCDWRKVFNQDLQDLYSLPILLT
jgi:hypothetical protein